MAVFINISSGSSGSSGQINATALQGKKVKQCFVSPNKNSLQQQHDIRPNIIHGSSSTRARRARISQTSIAVPNNITVAAAESTTAKANNNNKLHVPLGQESSFACTPKK